MNYLLPFSVFFILIFLFLDDNLKSIHRISTHKLPTAFGGFLVILLIPITVILGINSDIISSYDRLNSGLSPNYNWLNPIDILKFPVDQFKINKGQYPANLINFHNAMVRFPNRKYSIIIDKSQSTNVKSLTNKRIESLVKSDINGIFTKKMNSKLDVLPFSDLMVLSAIKHIAADTINKQECKLEVLFYLGDTTFIPLGTKDIIINNEIKVDVINQTIDSLSKISLKSKGKKTNFKYIFNFLRTQGYLGKSTDKTFLNVFFLSDFDHDAKSENSFPDIDIELKLLNENKGKKIDQINLIKIEGKNNDIRNQEALNRILRKNFNHLYYYEWDENIMPFTSNPVEFISHIFSSVDNNIDQGAIYLYKIVNDSLRNYEYKGQFQLDYMEGDSVIIGMGNKSKFYNQAQTDYLSLNGNKLFTTENKLFRINSSKSFISYLAAESPTPKDLFLEVMHPISNIKVKVPILLHQVLTTTTCIFLILLYLTFVINLIFIFTYFVYCLYFERCKTQFMKNKILFFVSIVLPMVVIFYVKLSASWNYVNLILGLNIRWYVLIIFAMGIYIGIKYFTFSLEAEKK